MARASQTQAERERARIADELVGVAWENAVALGWSEDWTRAVAEGALYHLGMSLLSSGVPTVLQEHRDNHPVIR